MDNRRNDEGTPVVECQFYNSHARPVQLMILLTRRKDIFASTNSLFNLEFVGNFKISHFTEHILHKIYIILLSIRSSLAI